MRVITNKFLRRISLEPIESIYIDQEDLMELDVLEEIKSIDKRLNDESIQMYLHLLSTNSDIKGLLTNSETDEEKEVIITLVSLYFYYTKFREVRNRMNDQLRLCEKLIESDICKRNALLKNEAIIEAEKLKIALKTDWVIYSINRLDHLYSKQYPLMSLKKRYVKISHTMNCLSLHARDRFFTEEEAHDYLFGKSIGKKPLTENAETLIYDRIKKYIWKKS